MQRYSINIFVDDSDRILLLRRSARSGFAPGLWGLCGGKIELYETPAQWSRREAHEELGENILYQSINRLGPVRDTWYGGEMRIWLFAYGWLGGEIRLNHEHTDYSWVGADDYPNYDVVKGVDENLAWFSIWPHDFLNAESLPPNLRNRFSNA